MGSTVSGQGSLDIQQLLDKLVERSAGGPGACCCSTSTPGVLTMVAASWYVRHPRLLQAQRLLWRRLQL